MKQDEAQIARLGTPKIPRTKVHRTQKNRMNKTLFLPLFSARHEDPSKRNTKDKPEHNIPRHDLINLIHSPDKWEPDSLSS